MCCCSINDVSFWQPLMNYPHDSELLGFWLKLQSVPQNCHTARSMMVVVKSQQPSDSFTRSINVKLAFIIIATYVQEVNAQTHAGMQGKLQRMNEQTVSLLRILKCLRSLDKHTSNMNANINMRVSLASHVLRSDTLTVLHPSITKEITTRTYQRRTDTVQLASSIHNPTLIQRQSLHHTIFILLCLRH